MIAEIKAHLKELEKREKLKILLAVESGSRAWGFPSPDSDYDVRIIYIRHPDWYFSIDNKKDAIDYFHGELLDINGWDIRKTLRLLRKSNATPFEWAQSPVVYCDAPGFRERLLQYAMTFFQPVHSLNHYKGIANNSCQTGLTDGKIKLKKLFYVIRPILAANWILKNKTVPPMDIFNLLKVVDDNNVKEKILALIKIKETANEDYVYAIEPEVTKFVEDYFDVINTAVIDQTVPTENSEVLTEFYRELYRNY